LFCMKMNKNLQDVSLIMVKSKPKTTEEILTKLNPKQKEIAEKIRAIIKNVLPDVVEMVRRGKITYVLNGKDFASISLAKDHVDLDLVAGTKVGSDLLKGRGTGKDVRHIKITTMKNIEEPEFTRLLKDAAAIG
jgi:hypothetical protein